MTSISVPIDICHIQRRFHPLQFSFQQKWHYSSHCLSWWNSTQLTTLSLCYSTPFTSMQMGEVDHYQLRIILDWQKQPWIPIAFAGLMSISGHGTKKQTLAISTPIAVSIGILLTSLHGRRRHPFTYEEAVLLICVGLQILKPLVHTMLQFMHYNILAIFSASWKHSSSAKPFQVSRMGLVHEQGQINGKDVTDVFKLNCDSVNLT